MEKKYNKNKFLNKKIKVNQFGPSGFLITKAGQN